jgi:hypothetical protein
MNWWVYKSKYNLDQNEPVFDSIKSHESTGTSRCCIVHFTKILWVPVSPQVLSSLILTRQTMELTQGMYHACLLLQSCICNSTRSWTCQLCEAQMNPYKFKKKTLNDVTHPTQSLPPTRPDLILKLQLKMYTWKKYGQKLATERVNTQYWLKVFWACSICPVRITFVLLFKRRAEKKPSTLSFCLAVPAIVKDYDMTENSHSFDCEKIVLTRNLNNCAPTPVYIVSILTCKPLITPHKVLIRKS